MEEISTMRVDTTLSGRNPMNFIDTAIIPESRKTKTTTTTTTPTATSQDVLLVQASSEDDSVATNDGLRKTVSILAIAPTKLQLQSEATGATVFVGAGGTSSVASGCIAASSAPANWRQTCIPDIQTVNGYGTNNQDNQQKELKQQLHAAQSVGQRQQQQSTKNHHSAQHVVKIRINPELDTSRVISTIRLNPDSTDERSSSVKKSIVNRSFHENNGTIIDRDNSADEIIWARSDDVARLSGRSVSNESTGQSESCVRISVVSGSVSNDQQQQQQQHIINQAQIPKSLDLSKQHQDEMIQQRATTNDSINTTSINRGSACFYYGSFPNSLTSMTMSSGQCSPSDTLDSGTCSDLDGTPPPLPKKKNSSTVLLGVSAGNGSQAIGIIGKGVGIAGQQKSQQHNRSGSVTSSCPEMDSDDNESNISCDSLNSGDISSRIVEHRSIKVNGIAVVDGDDKIAKTVNHEIRIKNEDSQDIVDDTRVTSSDDCSSVKDDIAVHERHDVNDNDNNSGDIKNNNNNNNNNSNNNNNIDNNKNDEVINANGTKCNSNVDEEMNERNNGKFGATNEALLPAEMITTASCSSSTNETSPSVSPSPSVASSLSKASSTPRVRSPVSNGHLSPVQSSPMVKECTYEERKSEAKRINEENAAADYYANYNRKNGTKYLYDDDRFYNFHINEKQSDNDNGDDEKHADKESDEFFAGYKILDREAIRSAKGTVRGVKNRVRAGIATFLQKPSAKNYKTKDAGKIVVYTTSMSIVRETYFACIKMLQMLKTHMVKHEVRDMFMSRELQTELKERIGCETIEVPQLFIDGQYIGNADVVERLNESGELRRMFKPYKSLDACTTCNICGGCRLLPCQICKGSKKSPVRNDFMKEFYWLRCMNCDDVGLVRCKHC